MRREGKGGDERERKGKYESERKSGDEGWWTETLDSSSCNFDSDVKHQVVLAVC